MSMDYMMGSGGYQPPSFEVMRSRMQEHVVDHRPLRGGRVARKWRRFAAVPWRFLCEKVFHSGRRKQASRPGQDARYRASTYILHDIIL